eukprot:1749696-Rhodomonas_salina.1
MNVEMNVSSLAPRPCSAPVSDSTQSAVCILMHSQHHGICTSITISVPSSHNTVAAAIDSSTASINSSSESHQRPLRLLRGPPPRCCCCPAPRTRCVSTTLRLPRASPSTIPRRASTTYRREGAQYNRIWHRSREGKGQRRRTRDLADDSLLRGHVLLAVSVRGSGGRHLVPRALAQCAEASAMVQQSAYYVPEWYRNAEGGHGHTMRTGREGKGWSQRSLSALPSARHKPDTSANKTPPVFSDSLTASRLEKSNNEPPPSLSSAAAPSSRTRGMQRIMASAVVSEQDRAAADLGGGLGISDRGGGDTLHRGVRSGGSSLGGRGLVEAAASAASRLAVHLSVRRRRRSHKHHHSHDRSEGGLLEPARKDC